ncbi:MAG: hypothetical protein ACODAJ_16320 [Planctomycetota bacterium]
MAEPSTLDIQASDVSGQKVVRVRDLQPDLSVGELIEGLLAEMHIPTNDVEGRPLTYQARLDREGRHLHASEVVGDALEPEDHIVLQPNIDAGLA